MATRTNLFIDAGADYSAIITVNESDGTPFDLTDYTVKSQIRRSYASSTYHDFTATLYDAEAGQLKLAMTAAQTTAITPTGRWLYDVEITYSDDTKNRVVEGVVIVTPQITQT